MSRCLRVMVHGRVQGVGFRYYTRLEAERLGLTGWVRNLADGTVEVQICGGREALSTMCAWLRHGPVTANVRDIAISEGEPVAGERGFRIR